METPKYNLTLNYEQIEQLIKQLSNDDKYKLSKELEKYNFVHDLNEEKIKEVLRDVRPYLNRKLGKYTHKKKSNDFYFNGLAFSHKELGYVFGFNFGFFNEGLDTLYSEIGVNVTITTNKENPIRREKYLQFFRENLQYWVNKPEKLFEHPQRGDQGVEFIRYKPIKECKSLNDVSNFIKESLKELQKIYPLIIQQPEIFEGVVRAAPNWNETIIDICTNHQKN